jgi:hypothetical protein
VCVSGLRSAFAAVPEAGILTVGSGYALAADPMIVDCPSV